MDRACRWRHRQNRFAARPRRFAAGATRTFGIISLIAPDFGGDLDDQAQLVPLLGRGEVVALLGRGKAALRRQAQLADVGVLRGLLDAAHDVIPGLQLTALGRHDPEHHLLALGQVAQRLEPAGPLIVPLAEEPVHVELVEQRIRDEVVAAFGRPHGLVVPAAGVRGHRHVGRPARQGLVDRGDVRLVLVQRVASDLGDVRALRGVVHVSQARVVQLEVTAAEVVKLPDFLGVGRGQVVPELPEVRVHLLVDRGAAAPVVHHAGRRDGELGRLPGGHVVPDERERAGEDGLGQGDRRDDVRRRRRPLKAPVLVAEGDPDRVVLDLPDAAERVDEVHVPRLAAQFAVGRGPQAYLTLHLDDVADRGVLHLRELFGADLPGREVVTGSQHLRRTQQAAHVVGTERGSGGIGHASLLLCSVLCPQNARQRSQVPAPTLPIDGQGSCIIAHFMHAGLAIVSSAIYKGRVTTRPMQEATFLILTALARGSQHGYGIISDVAEISGSRVRLRAGTLYTALDRLRADGLIDVDREEVVDNRLRRYYRLTPEGGRRLAAEAARLQANASAAFSRLNARPALGGI